MAVWPPDKPVDEDTAGVLTVTPVSTCWNCCVPVGAAVAKSTTEMLGLGAGLLASFATEVGEANEISDGASEAKASVGAFVGGTVAPYSTGKLIERLRDMLPFTSTMPNKSRKVLQVEPVSYRWTRSLVYVQFKVFVEERAL
mgnify:FL=1